MRLSIFLICLLAMLLIVAGVSEAQSWSRLKTPPGTISKFGVQVCKERVVAGDSTTSQRIVGSDTTVAIYMGKIPARSMITAAHVYVKTAFAQLHGSKKDSISIGSYTDVDAYMEPLAVSTTGVKSGTLTSLRYCAADSLLYLYFLKRGTIASLTGDVVGAIEYVEFQQ